MLQVLVEFAQRLLGSGKCCFCPFPFRYIFSDDVYSDNTAIRLPQRMPTGNPYMVGIEFIHALSMNFDPDYRLSGARYGLNNLLDLVGNLRNGFAHRAPDVISD